MYFCRAFLKSHYTFYSDRNHRNSERRFTVSLALRSLTVCLLPHSVHFPFKSCPCPLPTHPDDVWSVWQTFLMASDSDTCNTEQVTMSLGVSHVSKHRDMLCVKLLTRLKESELKLDLLSTCSISAFRWLFCFFTGQNSMTFSLCGPCT